MSPHRHFILYLCFLLLSQIGCRKSPDASTASLSSGTPMPSPANLQDAVPSKQPEYPELEFFDERAEEEKDSSPLDYNGFQIRRKTKKALIEGTIKPTELSFAQLLRNGKVVKVFDEVEHPMGNETRFGLFPFLSPDSRQLLVQQDAWRSSRQWIVSLETSPKVLIDSRDYQLERFRAVDLDRDGQFEVAGYQRYWNFEFLKGLTYSSADSPDIQIVFRYDPKKRQYEPANPHFKSYLLEGLEEIKSRFDGTDRKTKDGYSLIRRMSDVMQGTMTLALAGKENAAWEFFDRNCPAEEPEEKADAKARIRFAIRENTIYKTLKRTHQL